MCYDTGPVKKSCLLPLCLLFPLPEGVYFSPRNTPVFLQESAYTLNELILLRNIKVFSPNPKGKREVHPFYYKQGIVLLLISPEV